MGHTFSNILTHIIFSTKGRMNLLYPEMQDELYKYVCGVATNNGGHILQINGIEDHIHILVKIKPCSSISDFVRTIKVASSGWIHERFHNMKDFGWQSGYSAFSVSKSSVHNVVSYIRTQKEHHQRLSFKEELKAFLEKNEIEFDENHYFD